MRVRVCDDSEGVCVCVCVCMVAGTDTQRDRETCFVCSSVLQQYCKLNEQMEEKQYYSALKTLEQLEHTFLPRVRG